MTSPVSSMNEIHANSLLASTFTHPREVLAHPFLDNLQKRCILATRASDAFAVEGKPWLRQIPGSPTQVMIGDIINALKMLDDGDGTPPCPAQSALPRPPATPARSVRRRGSSGGDLPTSAFERTRQPLEKRLPRWRENAWAAGRFTHP